MHIVIVLCRPAFGSRRAAPRTVRVYALGAPGRRTAGVRPGTVSQFRRSQPSRHVPRKPSTHEMRSVNASARLASLVTVSSAVSDDRPRRSHSSSTAHQERQRDASQRLAGGSPGVSDTPGAPDRERAGGGSRGPGGRWCQPQRGCSGGQRAIERARVRVHRREHIQHLRVLVAGDSPARSASRMASVAS